MKKAKFNAVEMKRQGAEIVRNITKNMTREEEYKFWEEQTQNLKQEKQVQQKKSA